MEYEELDAAGQRELLKNNIRSWEQQHMARSLDQRRFASLLVALNGGEFKDVDARVRKDREINWTQQRDLARIDVWGFENDIALAKEALAALPPDTAAADGGE